MAFCPNCRYEYITEVSECPDCGAALVNQLPELPDVPLEYKDVKWVPLRALSGLVYAKMVTDVLDQHNIPNYIQSLSGSGSLGVITGSNIIGAFARIFVPENRFKEACDVQDEIIPDVDSDDTIHLT